ncbi:MULTISPECIES: hypothetical protein [unclassified Butyrivibrio]|uniref:hypothetical protein n=1 Tax=unclassified Butyrivibrio TaxID=2639466 RepID=UPI000417A30A|nr:MULTISPECIES: hypothetical protein [unclassified Butyrivibrio]SEM20188.1 hypothetical protein SAMN04487770_12862 [Butyrivibrio sp. ob235]
MVRKEAFSKESLKKILKDLFGLIEYDQWMNGFSDEEYDKYLEEDDDVIINALSDRYVDAMYPKINKCCEEYIPDMEGHIADMELSGTELFYCPAIKVYDDVEAYYYDSGMELWDINEVYLLADGDVVLVQSIKIEIGNFELVYRNERATLKNREDFYFDEVSLFENLEAIGEGTVMEENE